MRIGIIWLLAVMVLGFAPTATPASGEFALCTTQAMAQAAPRLQLAACRHVQCNCRYECIAWEGTRCVQTYRTCDTCSICDD
jgi:hypothetical protein